MSKKARKALAFAAALCMTLSQCIPAFAQSAFYREPASKKGLLCQTEAMLSDCIELGTDQVIFNVPMSAALNSGTLQAYDSFINKLDANGISITVVLLNDRQSIRPELIYGDQNAAGEPQRGTAHGGPADHVLGQTQLLQGQLHFAGGLAGFNEVAALHGVHKSNRFHRNSLAIHCSKAGRRPRTSAWDRS